MLVLALVAEAGPLPDGNALVREMVTRQRHREAILNDYTYDVLETKDDLDKAGQVKNRKTRRLEVFYMKGREMRRLVEENGRPLSPERQAREDAQNRAKLEAIESGKVATEEPGVRLSAIMDRYDFRAVGREDVDARTALVLEFQARPGKRDLDRDNVLRNLAGRLWVDEAEQEVVRASIHNTSSIKFALGLGASVSSAALDLEFRKVDDQVWLPRRAEATAAGRLLIFKGFRVRTTAEYEHYRRFQVDAVEEPSAPR